MPRDNTQRKTAQLSIFDIRPEPAEKPAQAVPASVIERVTPLSSGEKAKARDALAAIRALKQVEARGTPATPEERDALARFPGFGPLALSIFPNPGTGKFKPDWEAIGQELRQLLTPEEYASARRTTFNAFYTSPVVIDAMHDALKRLGVPENALVLEPGCGIGKFIRPGYRFLGVELDGLSGRIARALHPGADIRVENFADSRLPELDAAIGNVPFADLRLEWRGQKFALHDFFLAKSADALKPGGVLALVTSHFTLDKQNAAIREHLAESCDFLGAIRLPSDAFKREGTQVVTDIVFLRKRGPGREPQHAADWLGTGPLEVEGATVGINRYFLERPEMVLGTWSRSDTLYGEGYSVTGSGDLAEQLKGAIERLPRFERSVVDYYFNVGSLSVPHKFTPPPPEKHISEGSFFVRDGRVHQVVDGQGEPVTYANAELWAGKGTNGRRVGMLIELRDKARRVLQSQNEGWPDGYREQARRELNRAYDTFTAAFGPVNKTTVTETAAGGTVRRMPNLAKFREDPDAMLVMALEEYDEEAATAKKAPIMLRDVVGKSRPVTSVQTAEEGLLASLDRCGQVDMPLIASLYGKPEAEVAAELGDLVYLAPSGEWQTADEYLSGNVRAKLAEAVAAGAERNAAALRAVQPEDVLPGDIDANLGAPWIPPSDVQAFASGLFGGTVAVARIERDAVWSVTADWAAEQSAAARTDYGTARANGCLLLDLALNLRTPTVYDPDPSDPDKRVVNPEQTLAAKEKQRAIRERFKEWVFADHGRTERLVRLYNDTFNNLRPRQFDGSHLRFPGMTGDRRLRPHQKDGVWRVVSGGNTLLAHVVGGGKTGIMAAASMKLRQAGLVKKPMLVVPNHLLEQFCREFQQWYPNAKLLMATKDDFARERRKYLTAKVAGHEWDAVIVTHSSFERIGMGREFRAAFLQEQIDEYDALLSDRAVRSSRNLIKTVEKQKAQREARLKDLMAGDKKDDGLAFDELGVDYVFYDESAAVKNLETPTKMERVAGINTGGSERAFDMLMKARHLGPKGLTFANGTPVSNSMVELYTTQRFLDPDGLRARGVEHFDAWAATFGEVVEAMELSPDGKTFRPRARFSKFVNIPELQQMFRSFADVRTAEMLDLPRPALKGGKAQVVACPMSDAQKALQDELVERYERVRSTRVDPRVDNALAITTDGRKLALDARMLGPGPDFPGSKVNALAANVRRIWGETAPAKGTQIVFSDFGVHPTEWGFSAYHEVTAKLVQSGIPPEQIAAIGEADTDAKKQALFEKVRNGSVRVLLGSTAKLGTGTNVQRRLVALHHLDAPWKPAEVEQRDGRILRQGNGNAEVAIYRYVTEGSFDAYMWQALETKARFIAQVMTGELGVRRADDVGEQTLSFAEVKAIASGNPAVLTLAEADAELQRLAVVRRSHADGQFLARRSVRELPEAIARAERHLAALRADAAVMETSKATPPADGLAKALDRIPEDVAQTRAFPLGTYRGLACGVELRPGGYADAYLEGQTVRRGPLSESRGPRAVLNALGRVASGYAEAAQRTERELDAGRGQLEDYRERVGRAFPHQAYMDELSGLRDQLKAALSDRPPEGTSASDLAERINALRAVKPRAEAVPPVKPAAAEPQVVEPQVEPEPEEERPTFAARVARRGGQMSLF